MIRIEIMKILKKHLEKIDGLTYGRWLAGELDEDRLPIIDVRDRRRKKDATYGHKLLVEIELTTKSKARSETIDETLELMQQISNAVRDAVEEMCFHGELVQDDMDADKGEYKFIGSLMHFELNYTAGPYDV